MGNHKAMAVLLILASTPAVSVHAQSGGDAEQTVLRAQVLLDRANFSPGEIDGRSGSNFATALAGFQRSRSLVADGRLGPKTWTELERDAAPTLVDYTVLAADVQGPFLAVPADVLARSKLKALGYASADEALGEQFHSGPALLHALNPDQALDQVGGILHVPNVLDIAPPAGGALIRVDRSARTVSLEDKDGNTIAQFPASTGSKHDPLPVGDWKVRGVAHDPVFSYNPDLFWDAKPADNKLQLPPGPNNPVGRVWIDLSKEHYGIHGTPEPSHIGKTESHGCIRLTNWSALLLSKEVSVGMPVVLQE